MSTKIREQTPIHRAVCDIVATHEQNEGVGLPVDQLPAMVGYANPTAEEQSVIDDALDDLKEHGEVYVDRSGETDTIRHVETVEQSAEQDGPTTKSVVEAVRELRADGNETAGVAREVIEDHCGEDRVERALHNGVVYEVSGRLKLTRR